MSLIVFQSPLFSAMPFFSHGFFTRQGGVSSGLFSSLNVGMKKGDSRENVQENKRRILSRLGVPTGVLCLPNQIHGKQVIDLCVEDENPLLPPSFSPIEADALVTNQKNLVLGIMTADCVPILFADENAQLIGAAHAGWRGILCGVVEETVKLMRLRGARNIKAALGPCIHKDFYEVGREIYHLFYKNTPDHGVFFTPLENKAGHFLFDLPGSVQSMLRKEGIFEIDVIPQDTYSQEALFFSCRRASHRTEPLFGNHLSAIVLT